jgi:DNA-binding GntR family transcriptional regulator
VSPRAVARTRGLATTTPRLKGASADTGRRASAYEKIKEAILGGALRPLERISEAEVATRLRLSRTPVREAFGLLAAEGLIVVVPRRGSFVSQLRIDDILEIYQVRTPLECMAARIAAETLDEPMLAELGRLVEAEAARQGSRIARESLDANLEFHQIIVGCVRNRRLKALVGQLQGQVHRARMLWPSTLARLDETWKEHAELVSALRARDPDRAEEAMRTHLDRARASTLDRMLPVTR